MGTLCQVLATAGHRCAGTGSVVGEDFKTSPFLGPARCRNLNLSMAISLPKGVQPPLGCLQQQEAHLPRQLTPPLNTSVC